MFGMRQRGKKPVAILVIWLIWWSWRDLTADTVLQQIDYALGFIALTLWLAIFVWFLDSSKAKQDLPVAPSVQNNTDSNSSKPEVIAPDENQLPKGDAWK